MRRRNHVRVHPDLIRQAVVKEFGISGGMKDGGKVDHSLHRELLPVVAFGGPHIVLATLPGFLGVVESFVLIDVFSFQHEQSPSLALNGGSARGGAGYGCQ